MNLPSRQRIPVGGARLALLVPLALLAGAAAPEARRWSGMDDAARAAYAATLRAEPDVARRLERATRPFLGTPYAHSPLGEGAGTDPDPRLRWDAVDCMTLLETGLALALAPSFDELLPTLDAVRYASPPPTFLNRNHFTEAQWLPHNVARGWLRDVTRELGGDRAVRLAKQFGPDEWKARKATWDLPLEPGEVPRGRFSLEVLPLAVARERAADIPSGTLLFVVRKDFRSAPTRVTHAGIVFAGKAGPVLRHASSKPFGRVVDEPLDHFLERNSRYEKWPVEGVSLYRVVAPARR